MIQQVVPSQLKFDRIIPRGFPSVFKQWRVDPMSSNKTWTNNDIVRFNFMTSSKGVFDPYRSYVQITVSCDQNTTPVGLLQIDNSAQSFFQQMVLYSKSRQIQRVTQYGIIASYLNDIGMTQAVAQGRQIQGLGYGSFDTMPYLKAVNSSNQTFRPTNGNTCVSASSGNIFPTIPNAYVQNQDSPGSSIANASRVCKGHVTSTNSILAGNDTIHGSISTSQYLWVYQAAQWGVFNNMRTQYHTNFIRNNYIQHTSSVPCFQLLLNPSVFSSGGYSSTASSISIPKNTTGSILYQTHVRTSLKTVLNFNNTASNSNSQTINCATFGFNCLFSPSFSRGTFQPFISPTVPQALLYQGKILQTKQPLYRRKFKVPIISGVMGILIQPSNFMLLPLEAISTCLMQLTLDPYGMFTSGYKDICQLDDSGMGLQQKRNWSIDRIEYKLHTYHFPQQQVEKYIQNSLYKQINFVSNFWSLGNQFQIPGGSGPNNSYIVGNGSKNLNQLVCLFVPNDYQVYSFCRKHYRISNNVNRFYVKMGVDYWPPQPYKGNGGNVVSNDIDDDNSIFVQNIYWSNNFMFSTSTPLPRINIYNFALNERPYDPTNRSTLYSGSMIQNFQYSFSATSVNADTAMGMSWIHQNRCVGKAAYVISFSPFSDQQNMIRGVDVSGLSNFECIFQSQNGPNVFPRDQTLYIYCRSSVLVSFGKDGIETYGR